MNDRLDERVTELLAGTYRRHFLGIAGPPGSGKSTFAQSLVERVNHRTACLFAVGVALDGFHFTNVVLDRRGLRPVKGAPQTFDVPALIGVLTRLRRNEPVAAPIYSRELHEPVPDALRIEPSMRLIVVEGNYLLLDEEPWRGVRELLDECWYLDVPCEVCMARVRDRHIRGGSTPELAVTKVETNDRSNYGLVAATRSRADRVIHPALSEMEPSRDLRSGQR